MSRSKNHILKDVVFYLISILEHVKNLLVLEHIQKLKVFGVLKKDQTQTTPFKVWWPIVFLIFTIIIISPIITAGSVGISPSHYENFFSPNLKKTYTFSVFNSNPNEGIKIYVKGDLAQYITLSEDFFIGKGTFEVTLLLPEYIDKPGKHRILIGAIESKTNSPYTDSSIGGIVAIQAPIDIYVPYPGKYIEARFNIDDLNEGENTVYKLEIDNLGTSNITTISKLEIYEVKSQENIIIETISFENNFLLTKESIVFTGILNSSKYKPGNYLGIVMVEYGNSFKINDSFRVGQLYVNITDYSFKFTAKELNKFNIEVENLWNSNMNNVYGSVTITLNGIIMDSFITPSIELKSWEKRNLTGFFDATKLKKGRYLANINIFYQENKTQKLVAIHLFDKPKNELLKNIIIGAILTIIIVFIIIFLLMKKIWKLKKNVKKRKNNK